MKQRKRQGLYKESRMSKTENNQELEELADWLIHEMSEAIDNTINAKYMEMDLD